MVLTECPYWVDHFNVLSRSAARQAQLLALIYFPPLRDPIQRYVSSYQNLCLVVADLYYKKPDGQSVGGRVYNHPDYQAARDAHVADKENLATQIEIHAVTYAKS